MAAGADILSPDDLCPFSATAFSRFFGGLLESAGAAATCPCNCAVITPAIRTIDTATLFIRLVSLSDAIGQ